MKKKHFFKLSILVATAILFIGCFGNKTPKLNKHTIANNSSKKVVPQKISGIRLSELNSGGVTKLSLRGNHNYKQGEPIQFIVDTKDADGYLYIIYMDNNGEIGVLYPNPKAPLSEISGKYIFPRDFGGMAITATKDCKGCEQDRTVIYALLSKEPIIDIQSINKSQLATVIGGESDKARGVKSKGISMDLGAGNITNNSNVNIGVLEFFVK